MEYPGRCGKSTGRMGRVSWEVGLECSARWACGDWEGVKWLRCATWPLDDFPCGNAVDHRLLQPLDRAPRQRRCRHYRCINRDCCIPSSLQAAAGHRGCHDSDHKFAVETTFVSGRPWVRGNSYIRTVFFLYIYIFTAPQCITVA